MDTRNKTWNDGSQDQHSAAEHVLQRPHFQQEHHHGFLEHESMLNMNHGDSLLQRFFEDSSRSPIRAPLSREDESQGRQDACYDDEATDDADATWLIVVGEEMRARLAKKHRALMQLRDHWKSQEKLEHDEAQQSLPSANWSSSYTQNLSSTETSVSRDSLDSCCAAEPNTSSNQASEMHRRRKLRLWLLKSGLLPPNVASDASIEECVRHEELARCVP